MKVQDLVDKGSLPRGSTTDTQQSSVPVMPDINISLNGLLNLLNNLKPGKAAGPDMLRPLLLKELREEIAPIIKVIYERSLQTGRLPADWVKANVFSKRGINPQQQIIALYPSHAFSARSLNIYWHQITKQLGEHGIMYDLQHGFREKRSCETQLVMMVEDLARNANVGKQTDIVLLDLISL